MKVNYSDSTRDIQRIQKKIYKIELGYNIMKGTEFFMSL